MSKDIEIMSALLSWLTHFCNELIAVQSLKEYSSFLFIKHLYNFTNTYSKDEWNTKLLLSDLM